MIERDINSPRTSSMGRLFDAAAAILGICDKATYEGEPAIELEAAAWRALDNEIAHFPDDNAGYFASGPSWLDGPYVLDQKALFEALLGGIEAGAPADRLALDFHVAVARSSARIASDICVHEGIDTVALSGGVFMNRLLLQFLTRKLKDAGLTVLIPQTVPVNDGCIAYGNCRGQHSVGGICGYAKCNDAACIVDIVNSIYAGREVEATGNNGSNGYTLATGLVGWLQVGTGKAHIVNCASRVQTVKTVGKAGGYPSANNTLSGILGFQNGPPNSTDSTRPSATTAS